MFTEIQFYMSNCFNFEVYLRKRLSKDFIAILDQNEMLGENGGTNAV